MDAKNGPATLALSKLSRAIREYSIFQAVPQIMARLRHFNPQLSEEQLYDLVEFQANPSFGFPGSDIDQVQYFEERGRVGARLRLNVLSLVGAGSPLPDFYGEQALEDGAKGETTCQFLDIFHHRLQRLLIPTWRKYRYYARFEQEAADPLSARLFALIGLGGKTIRESHELNWKRLLPYLGLLSLRAHSAALIESVLRYYFNHAQLTIEQCVERSVRIRDEQRNCLGTANNCLSEDLVLGEYVRDRSSKFRVHVRELDWQRFHDFLPIGTGYQPLCALVRFTLRDPLDYDICLVLRREEIHELRLDERNACRLGWTSWLGREHADGIVTLGSKTH